MSARADHKRPSPRPRPGITGLAPYIPGKSGEKEVGAGPVYKLSANESALGASPKAIAAYEEASLSLHRYPDGSSSALRDKIAEIHGLKGEQIVCGAGSDEILQLLCQAYLGEGDNIVQSAHGFLVYAIAAKANGASVHFADEDNLTACVDNILSKVDEKTRIVFLANPNNPTGTYLPDDDIRRLHAGLPSNVLFVIDAAYAEYMDADDYEAGAALVEEFDNVIMTRTFSKIYGLGGLRLGWAYGAPEVIDIINRVRGPFNVSAAAQAAGVTALEDRDFIERNRVYNKTERAIVMQRLSGMGLVVQPSVANFLLVRFPETPGHSSADIESYLAKNGVIVREMTAYGLPTCLRISIGEKEANARMLDLLSEKFESATS